MATTTAWIPGANPTPHLSYGVATIDNGETASLAVPCHGRSVVRLGFPTLTSGNITFTVTPYAGATAQQLKDSSGTAVTITAGTGAFVANVPQLSGCYEFTIVSGAAQGAARSIEVQMVGTNPSL